MTSSASIVVGSRVRVKEEVEEPSEGWGKMGVTHESVGVVSRVYSEGKRCTVDFAEHREWFGFVTELEPVEDDEDLGDLPMPVSPVSPMWNCLLVGFLHCSKCSKAAGLPRLPPARQAEVRQPK